MSLEALAEAIQVDASDIVRSLFMKGIMLSMNQVGAGCGTGCRLQLGGCAGGRAKGGRGKHLLTGLCADRPPPLPSTLQPPRCWTKTR
jgi:hypothetical protein